MNNAPGKVEQAKQACPPPASASGSTGLSEPLPGLRAWLSALKVVSLLAAVGFVAKLAHEQMLGIQLTDWSALDLSLFAGRWTIDTLTTLLDVLAQSHYLSLLLILLCLSPALSMIFMQRYIRILRVSRFLGIGFATVGLSFVIVHYEMPTLALTDWLTADLSHLASPTNGGHRAAREEVVRFTYFMSKTDIESDTELDAMKNATDAASTPGSTPASREAAYAQIHNVLDRKAAQLFPKLIRDCPITAPQAQVEMNGWYSTSLWITGIALFTLVVFVSESGRDLEDKIISAFYYFAAFVLLPVGFALLPYMYGKLICSSEFPKATVIAPSQQKTANGNQGEDDNPGILIGQGDKGYRLLSISNAATIIQVYSDPNVKVNIKPDSNQDIVKYVLSEKAKATI